MIKEVQEHYFAVFEEPYLEQFSSLSTNNSRCLQEQMLGIFSKIFRHVSIRNNLNFRGLLNGKVIPQKTIRAF